jgi:hypothetical protein
MRRSLVDRVPVAAGGQSGLRPVPPPLATFSCAIAVITQMSWAGSYTRDKSSALRGDSRPFTRCQNFLDVHISSDSMFTVHSMSHPTSCSAVGKWQHH